MRMIVGICSWASGAQRRSERVLNEGLCIDGRDASVRVRPARRNGTEVADQPHDGVDVHLDVVVVVPRERTWRKAAAHRVHVTTLDRVEQAVDNAEIGGAGWLSRHHSPRSM